jgi:hypothetical protein
MESKPAVHQDPESVIPSSSNMNSNIGSLNTSQVMIDEENVEKLH